MAKKKHINVFFGITARAMMTGAACLLLLSYLSRFANPAKLWFLTIFGLAFMPLVFLNVVLMVWAAYRRSSAFFIPFLALLPSVFILGSGFQVKGFEPDGSGVRIVTYNVGQLRASDLDPKACKDSVIRFLKSTDADIICIQEYNCSPGVDVGRELSRSFPGYHAEYFVNVSDHGSYGNVILSRFRVLDKGKMNFEKSANLALYADLMIGDTKIRVYNCHLESYNISLKRLFSGQKRDEIVKETETKMKKSITRRPKQVREVLKNIENCPVEAIVTGDFNDTPLSYTYYRLSKGRGDSFVDAGHGLGSTFNGPLPFLRIDYVLYPDHYKATGHKVCKDIKFSDHYPIITEINI